ncbi:unnamed protein product [Rhizophagus irregularis]|nr:unnamed protein product [Rhizophagus irregularis]
MIANEMTCPIDHEPTDQLCVLKCQHILSFNNLKKLKQKNCPKCRENIEDNDVRYLPQNVIYKHLYSQFFEAGHILPSIEMEKSTKIQYDSDSDDSEVDLILTKKKKILKAINAIKELEEKNYKNAEHWCKEFLKTFPESYSMRCILAYTYRCLNDYKQAHLYLNEAIELKGKKPNAWYIRGEIHLRQGNYNDAVKDLKTSINYNAKINYLYIMIGISYYNSNNNKGALKYFNIVLQNDPNSHLCLKYCAYIYERQGKFSDTLKMLDKLLSINVNDSLILCYYGEILSKMKQYNNAIIYFTKANNIDPENVHNLNRRAIAYFAFQIYDKALLDLNKAIQLDVSNRFAYYYKGLTYYRMKDIKSSIVAFNYCIELNHISSNINDISKYFNQIIDNIESKKYEDAALDLYILSELNYDISFVYLLQNYLTFWFCVCVRKSYFLGDYARIGIINNYDLYMYREQGIYFISNLKKFYSHQFKENNLNRHILSLKNDYLRLPEFSIADIFPTEKKCYDIIWKINIEKVISSDCFIRFIVEKFPESRGISHKLTYEDLLKLEGLGWILYVPLRSIYLNKHDKIQLSIETITDSIDMKIEYVRIIPNYDHKKTIYFPKMDHLIPSYTNNIPETFKDKYFLRKKTKNLLELKDIINNL